jgi:hypothetical protein
MGVIRKQLTYANVVATVALFLALSGGVVWAAGKIGAKGLKANAVTAGKIKRNAVTNAKIRGNAVTTAKIKGGAVNLAKLAPGTNLLATATGGPVTANGSTPITVPLNRTAAFTPATGTVAFLSVEAKGENLARVGTEKNCEPRVVPFVNGSEWDVAEGTLALRAATPTPERPTGLVPVSAATAPIGLTSPGVNQTVSVKVFGDPECTAASAVSVGIAVTQAK